MNGRILGEMSIRNGFVVEIILGITTQNIIDTIDNNYYTSLDEIAMLIGNNGVKNLIIN